MIMYKIEYLWSHGKQNLSEPNSLPGYMKGSEGRSQDVGLLPFSSY